MNTYIDLNQSINETIKKVLDPKYFNQTTGKDNVELLNLFNTQTYEGGDTTFTMNTQVRLRLAQIEYRLNEYVKLGVAPFWFLGPLPRNGYYKTPSSIYAHVQLKEGLSLETSFTKIKSNDFSSSFLIARSCSSFRSLVVSAAKPTTN